MARRRGKPGIRRTRKRAPARLPDIRQLHQAVSFRPVRVRKLPKDPPVTIHHMERTIRIPVKFMLDTDASAAAGFIGSPGATFDIPVYVTKLGTNVKVPEPVYLSPKLVAACFSNMTGMTTDLGKALDLAFRKVLFWGPSVGANIASPASIDLALDLGTYTTGISLADVGTNIHRPAVGASLPFLHWMESASTAAVIKFQWDSGNRASSSTFTAGRYEIGIAHITVTGRYVEEA